MLHDSAFRARATLRFTSWNKLPPLNSFALCNPETSWPLQQHWLLFTAYLIWSVLFSYKGACEHEHSSYATATLPKESSSQNSRVWVAFLLPSKISRKERRATLALAFTYGHGEITRRLVFLTYLSIFLVIVVIIILKSLLFIPTESTASSSRAPHPQTKPGQNSKKAGTGSRQTDGEMMGSEKWQREVKWNEGLQRKKDW